jgi:hypothetical protein
MTGPCIASAMRLNGCFAGLKGFRRVFSRFDKLDVMFTGFIHFALIVDALRMCQQALAGNWNQGARRSMLGFSPAHDNH